MSKRYEYVLDLAAVDWDRIAKPSPLFELRAVHPTDAPALATLMIEAYRGTIDYDGETAADAINEIQAYLAGARGGRALLEESYVARAGVQTTAACLASYWDKHQQPLITYVMTDASWKNRGLGGQLVGAVLQRLYEQGYQHIYAVITAGNIPSERLFGRLGFRKIE